MQNVIWKSIDSAFQIISNNKTIEFQILQHRKRLNKNENVFFVTYK